MGERRDSICPLSDDGDFDGAVTEEVERSGIVSIVSWKLSAQLRDKPKRIK